MDNTLKQSLARLLSQYNTLHTSGNGHDDRYYTKTEISDLLENMVEQPELAELETKLNDETSRAISVETLKAPINNPAFTGIPVAPTAPLGTSSTQLATTEFVQESVDDGIINSDAMRILGDLGVGGTLTSLPTVYKTGWTYKIISKGEYAGHTCEVGDMITALVDRDDGDIPENSDWWVIQTNIDGAITSIDNVDGYLTISRDESTIEINHKNISKEDATSSESLNFGGSFSAIKGMEVDTKGHLTKVLTTTFTLPIYSAENGISLIGTTFSNSGVRSISTGSSNGSISVDTNGTVANVHVKGLGSAAYTGVKSASSPSHTNYDVNGTYVPTMNFLSYWNGAFNSDGDSHLAYCNQGAFGSIITKSADDYSVKNHTHNYISLSGSDSIVGSLIPNMSDIYSLGDSSHRWNYGHFNYLYPKHIYIGGVNAITNETQSQVVYSSADITETSSNVLAIGSISQMYGMSTILRGYYTYLTSYMYVSSSSPIRTASDEKVKTFTNDIEDDEEALIKLFDIIKPKSYNYKYMKSQGLNIGFSAQEIETAMLELNISPEKYGILNIRYGYMLQMGDEEDSKYYTKFYDVSYNDLFSLSLLKMSTMEKQHIERLNSLEDRISALENK